MIRNTTFLPVHTFRQAPRMSTSQVPTSLRLAPHKYVVHAWKKNPITRRDPQAVDFFTSLALPPTLFGIVGSPMTLYMARESQQKAPELWFSEPDCEKFKAKLAISVGSERAHESWRRNVVREVEEMIDVKAVILRNPGELKAAMEEARVVQEATAIGRDEMELESTRKAYESGAVGRWVALDVETWEMDHTYVTEVGLSVLENDGTRVEKHIVVKENRSKRNGRYCPDARYNYAFGQSDTISEASVTSYLRTLLTPLPHHPLILVCHDPRSDLQALELLDIPISSFTHFLPTPSSSSSKSLESKVYVLNTQVLFSGISRNRKRLNLEKCCERLGITIQKSQMHNAGNDAKFTLDCLLTMMDADVVVKSEEEVESEKLLQRAKEVEERKKIQSKVNNDW